MSVTNPVSLSRQVVSLLVFGLLGGIFWRLEIELRFGWHGLNWLTGRHISSVVIPLFAAVWLWFFVPSKTTGQRVIRSLIAATAGFAAYVVYAGGFSTFYSRLFFSQSWRIALVVVGIVAVPWIITFLGWCFTPFFSHWLWLVLPVLFFAGIQLSIFLLWITAHRGGADTIHAVKSGFLITKWFWAAGVPFLWRLKHEKGGGRKCLPSQDSNLLPTD